jgi:hypothetical protein
MLSSTRTTGDAAALQQRQESLRSAVDELVGITFAGQMLKMARNPGFKGEYGHGGRGEDMFSAQLHEELARRAGERMKNGLSDAIYDRLVARIQ